MSDDFKKLDEWMMNASKAERERRISEKELEGFHDGVMKKILARQNAGPGFPYLGLTVMAVLSLAVIAGAVVYIHSVKVEKDDVRKAEAASLQKFADAQAIPPKRRSLDAPDDGKQFMSGSLSAASSNTAASQAPALTEAAIVEEIEALKELGAWTEEDEAEAGIPVEVTFADIEAGINLQQAPPPAAVQG